MRSHPALFAAPAALVASATLLACGGQNTPTGATGSNDGGPADGTTPVDAVATDALADGASGDDAASPPLDGAVDAGCVTGLLSFQLFVAAGSGTKYCSGTSNSCADDGLLIEPQGSANVLEQVSTCVATCSACEAIECAIYCAPSAVIGDAGSTRLTWDGTYAQPGTCGPSAIACQTPRCAPPGDYVAHMCAYAEVPDAATTGGTASQGCTATASAPTCIDVPFTWPPSGDAAVRGTIGVEADGIVEGGPTATEAHGDGQASSARQRRPLTPRSRFPGAFPPNRSSLTSKTNAGASCRRLG